MEDLLLISLLKNKNQDIYSEFFDNFKEVTKKMNSEEKSKFIDRLKDYDNKSENSFTESLAKILVSKMKHSDDIGNVYLGEKYNLLKAKEIYEKYKDKIHNSVSYIDLYIAMNYNYHKFYCIFNKHLNKNLDDLIFESTIAFWFDPNCYNSIKFQNFFSELD